MTEQDRTANGAVMSPTGERTSRMAVLSGGFGLVAVVAPLLSLLSAMYVTGFPPQIGLVAIPSAVAGIVLGVLARRQLLRDASRTGTGLALAGTILGVVALLMHLLPMALPASLVFAFRAGG